MINVFFGSVMNVLNMTGYAKDTLFGSLLGLVVNIGLSLTLASVYGAMGAAIGFFGSVVVWNIYLSYRLQKHLSIRVSVI
jgi:O-antigen/teichoic acid export membrane protein